MARIENRHTGRTFGRCFCFHAGKRISGHARLKRGFRSFRDMVADGVRNLPKLQEKYLKMRHHFFRGGINACIGPQNWLTKFSGYPFAEAVLPRDSRIALVH